MIGVDRREYEDLVELVQLQAWELKAARSQIDQLRACLGLVNLQEPPRAPNSASSECLLVADSITKVKEPTVYIDLEDVVKLDSDVGMHYCAKLKQMIV